VLCQLNYFIHIIEKTSWNLNRLRPLKKEGDLDDWWTIKTKISRVEMHPDFIREFAEDNTNLLNDKIKEEHKEYLEIIEEIDNILIINKDKLNGLKEEEEESINNIIKEITKEYPEIFDIEWENVLFNTYPEIIKKLNELIKISEKSVRFNCIKKHINLTRQLKNYDGFIRYGKPENKISEKERELRTHIYNDSGRVEAEKRVKKYNKNLLYNLKRTVEYKEAKVNLIKLKEELDERKTKEDKRVEILDSFKEKIEEMFTELMGNLEEIDEEISE